MFVLVTDAEETMLLGTWSFEVREKRKTNIGSLKHNLEQDVEILASEIEKREGVCSAAQIYLRYILFKAQEGTNMPYLFFVLRQRQRRK